MHQVTEPTRPQLDLRDGTWPVPGRTVTAWASGFRYPFAPAVISNPALTECVCPTDCILDHETE